MSQTTRETIAEIWSIAWPMIVAYVSVPAMGIADTAVMGHLENPSHLGGMGLGANFFAFFYSLFAFLRRSAHFAAATLAANLVLMQLFYLAAYVLDGFSNACEALAGRAQGAGDERRVHRMFVLCSLCAATVGTVFSLAYLAGGSLFIRALSGLPDVVNASEQYRFWLVTLPPVLGVAFVMEGLFVGTLRTAALRNAAIIACLVFFTICLVSPLSWGNHGLWLSMLVYFAVRPVIGYVLWVTERNSQSGAATVLRSSSAR